MVRRGNMRLSKEQMEGLKKRFKVDRLWSYSRVSTYLEHAWEYRIVYIEKLTRASNVYTYFGTICHDIIQGMYDKEHSYDEMSDKFDNALLDWKIKDSGYKFMNENIERGYVDNLKLYFQETEVIPYKVRNETPVCVQFKDSKGENIIFIGYIDSEYIDDDGVLNIVDYKTSSKSGFTGKKLEASSRQLKLYAIGVHQTRGIPYEKIRLRYDLMKYVQVGYLQKNGKWKYSKQERAKWVSSQENRIRTLLLDFGYSPFEIDDIVEDSIAGNTIENLPKEIQEKFTTGNCYVDVRITEKEAKELERFFVKTIEEIREKEQCDDLDEAFPEEVIDETNEFYYTQLAPQLLKYNKGYQEKQAMLKMRSTDDDDVLESILDLFK